MITTRIMANGAATTVYPSGKTAITREVFGLSTDTKPVENMNNGDLFIEMDTGTIYAFDEANAMWRPL